VLLRIVTGAPHEDGERFQYGLGILIDGLRARHARQGRIKI
jgi:hypothetical protein